MKRKEAYKQYIFLVFILVFITIFTIGHEIEKYLGMEYFIEFSLSVIIITALFMGDYRKRVLWTAIVLSSTSIICLIIFHEGL